jgi:hypothetical protein
LQGWYLREVGSRQEWAAKAKANAKCCVQCSRAHLATAHAVSSCTTTKHGTEARRDPVITRCNVAHQARVGRYCMMPIYGWQQGAKGGTEVEQAGKGCMQPGDGLPGPGMCGPGQTAANVAAATESGPLLWPTQAESVPPRGRWPEGLSGGPNPASAQAPPSAMRASLLS